MIKRSDEDLFASTTMSFGDHLEELRVCLFKSVVALVVGFCVGLAFANWAVSYIQTPLKAALEEHYIAKALNEMRREYGGNLPPDVHRFVEENRLVFDNVYIEADEWRRVDRLAAHAGRQERPSDDGPRPPDEPTASDGTAAAAKTVPLESRTPAPGTPALGGAAPGGTLPASAEPDLIVGRDVPPPHAPLVATRIWRPIHTVVKALNAQEAFMIWMKAGFVVGLILASPYVFVQIWKFVAAGLYQHERRFVHIYLPFSLILFLGGAAVAFFFVFKYVLQFLFGFNAAMQIDPDPRINEWLGFVMMMPLGFGLAFQLPLVMLFLYRIGVFSLEAYVSHWRVSVLSIALAAIIFTPPDPVSMILMMVPLIGLYFLGIGLCKWMPRNKSPFGEGYEP